LWQRSSVWSQCLSFKAPNQADFFAQFKNKEDESQRRNQAGQALYEMPQKSKEVWQGGEDKD